MSPPPPSDDPHADIPVHRAGTPVIDAAAAVLLLHGRGGRAKDMFTLADAVPHENIAYVAPQADGYAWYPQSFMAEIDANEPFLTSALGAINRLMSTLEEEHMSARKIVLLGFSQGACLSLEYAARNPRRYGGVVAFSGGLIGPQDHTFQYEGSLEETPVFLGCSDHDPHIPLPRVNESTRVFEELQADVTERIYPDMGHTVNDDEISYLRELLGTI